MEISDTIELMASVINLRTSRTCARPWLAAHVHGDAVLIDRRTRWGNPFRIGPGQDRERAVALYRADLWRRIREGEIALEDLAALASCRLACWCHPDSCHGHVLARAADWAKARLDAHGP